MANSIYELTYILDGVLSDEEIKDLVGRVHAYITKNGGTLLEVNEWGTKELAYPIKKRRTGYYVNLHFEAPSELPAKLERVMRINERVLRFLTLVLDAKMMRHWEKKKAEANAAPVEEAPTPVEKTRVSVEEVPAPAKVEAPVSVEEVPTSIEGEESAPAEA